MSGSNEANAEVVLLVQMVDGFRRSFEKEGEALRSIRAAIHKQAMQGMDYHDGIDMGAFAVAGIAGLEHQVRVSMEILQTLIGPLMSEETWSLCTRPLFQIQSDDTLLQVLENDLLLLARKVDALQALQADLLSADPQQISDSLPEHVRGNIAEMIEREIGELGQDSV